MKILVPIKRVPNPDQPVTISKDAIDLTVSDYIVNPFDEYALEAALRLTEKIDDNKQRFGEVVVLSIGPGETEQQIRSCLAMGADRGIIVQAEDAELDSDLVARIMLALFNEERPDLLLMGKQTVDGDNSQVPQLVAGYLGLPQACFAASIETAGDERSLVVGREVDGGVEYKKVRLPAVVSVDLRIVMPTAVKTRYSSNEPIYKAEPRLSSLMAIMQAKNKPMEARTIHELGIPLQPKVKLRAIRPPPNRKSGVLVDSVETLLDKLHNHDKII